jgi:hypothetical protein
VDGVQGADYVVKMTGWLPDGYVSKEEARKHGWEPRYGNLRDALPDAMVYTVYKNSERKLPDTPGRVWYEADINYFGGYRNKQRLLFSNDGLMFVTYDHYNAFYEII